MEYQTNHYFYDKRPIFKSKAPAVRWVREWVPQEVASTGGKCSLLKWVTEDKLAKLRDRSKDPQAEEPEPEPTSEVLFLCSYEGCGKTFMDAGALRKHSHIHGERQFICHFEGCGKAFSLDFNLRAHMRTHSQENYHICPHADCGKRYAHEYKLKTHIKTHHEKNGGTPEVVKQTLPPEKPPVVVHHKPAFMDRPYACPYEGCDKSYIHEYKLNLHFKREHPGHNNADDNGNKHAPEVDNDMDEGSDHDPYTKSKGIKRSKPSKPVLKMPPSKSAQRKTSIVTPNMDMPKKQWSNKDVYEEEDSEETEDEGENVEDNNRWRYMDTNEDDEETEDED
ncbi:hypothetical protein GIB67_026253 [Kingdonia uniflora]|uniref:C2H2-type domain-containing protein n=1 Tax=Kingdonia uniflora TaxID=39325 RepID=A0A7J7L9T3_9MAGN|nr:hypothetical protein GIB67_026253 [Kingdonia uniflora]